MKEIGRERWLIMYHKNIFVNNDLSSSLSLRCNKNKSMILQFAIIIRIRIRNVYNVVILWPTNEIILFYELIVHTYLDFLFKRPHF